MVVNIPFRYMQGREKFGMAKIGDKTIAYWGEVIAHLLKEHQEGLDDAYRHAEGALTVSITLHQAEPDKGGANKVSVGISFVQARVKEKTDPVVIEEDQMGLFDGQTAQEGEG